MPFFNKISLIICIVIQFLFVESSISKTIMAQNPKIFDIIANQVQNVKWDVNNIECLSHLPKYNFFLSEDKGLKEPNETGMVRFAWDSNYLYVFAEFADKDILATGMEDQLPHYKLGDVLEIFIKPEAKEYYWELFVTPLGKKTSLFWEKRGTQGSNGGDVNKINLEAICRIKGTLNNSSDIDIGWQALVRIPKKDMTMLGDHIENAKWRILIARQNYTAMIDPNHRELSMVPRLARTNFHSSQEYAEVIFKD